MLLSLLALPLLLPALALLIALAPLALAVFLLCGAYDPEERSLAQRFGALVEPWAQRLHAAVRNWRCEASSRMIGISPRAAGFVYRRFVPLSLILLSLAAAAAFCLGRVLFG